MEYNNDLFNYFIVDFVSPLYFLINALLNFQFLDKFKQIKHPGKVRDEKLNCGDFTR